MPVPRAVDLVVIGGGVMGTATALAAARRGLRTVLLERFSIGHRHGSSHGPSRIIRLAYHAVDYIALAREAFDRWRALERECGLSLVRTTGGLDCGMPGTPSLELTIDAMRQAGVPFHLLDGRDLAARFPQIRCGPGMVGAYQPDAAVLHADDCVSALARRAAQCGAQIQENTQVRRVETTPDGVHVVTDNVGIRAGAAVIAAGSWAGALLAGLGFSLPLSVTREQVAYFEAGPGGFEIGQFPLVLEHWPALTSGACSPPLAAAFPRLSPDGLVKLMFHCKGPVIDPDNFASDVDSTALADLTDYATERFPGLDAVRDTETCRYTMTPDEDFIVDIAPGHPRVAVVSACSGHGFKFGPVMGEMAVDLLTEGATNLPSARFAANRPTMSNAR